MYLEFYGLDRPPFSITPDPQFVYLSEPHREALAHLLYGVRQGGGGGFVQLTGEVGTGKTTLSRLLLSQLPEGTHAALVLNPRLGPEELLLTICEELRLPIAGAARNAQTAQTESTPPSPTTADGRRDGDPGADSSADSGGSTPLAPTKPGRRRTAKAATATASVTAPRPRKPPARPNTHKPPTGKQLFDALGAHLLQTHAAGGRVVLIIDEAQNLSAEALEQVRLLTNLETETQKLLQILLIGQPELRDMLARPELRQLAQRITARYHLVPLDAAGTEAYLRHRINSAGGLRFPFAPEAVQRLHRRSGGVPRLINIIAERALLGGYAHDLLSVDARTVDRAANEALPPASGAHMARSPSPRWPAMLQRRGEPATVWVPIGLTVAAAGLALWLWRDGQARDDALPAKAPTTQAEPAMLRDTPATTSTPSSGPPTSGAAASRNATPGRTPLLDAATVANLAARDPDAGAGPWAELRRRWSAPSAWPASLPACTTPPAPGWECLRGRIGLETLARIGRPVLLRLETAAEGDKTDPAGSGWVLLQGLGPERARLWLRGQTFDLDRAALTAVWSGESLALWPTPQGLDAALDGDDAALATWLRGRPSPPDEMTLARGLRGFQTAHGLRADGRSGGVTRFALAAYGDGPRLTGLE